MRVFNFLCIFSLLFQILACLIDSKIIFITKNYHAKIFWKKLFAFWFHIAPLHRFLKVEKTLPFTLLLVSLPVLLYQSFVIVYSFSVKAEKQQKKWQISKKSEKWLCQTFANLSLEVQMVLGVVLVSILWILF